MTGVQTCALPIYAGLVAGASLGDAMVSARRCVGVADQANYILYGDAELRF